jgi:PAS domain-containing protein
MTRDSEGQPLLMFGTHLDITERKRIEAELKESNTRLMTVMNSMDGLHLYRGYADL